MRKNFLRAVLLILLTFATAFFTVSCLEIDNSEPLEHISVVNVPESIRIGKFNEANIKVRIVSGSTRELFPIKEEMIPEPYKSMLSVVGEHEITLLYRGEKVTFTVVIRDTIVLDVNFKNALGDTVTSYTVSEDDLSDITPPTDEEMAVEGYRFLGTFDKDYTTLTDSADVYGQYVKTWKVAFYNGEEEIISEQIVDDGQSALEPTEEERSMQGFEWVCWDNSFDIITKDTKVCGFYVAISTQGDDDEELTPTSDEYFTFRLLSDDTYEIKAKDVNNMPSEVVLPESFNGAPVTIIANKAFYGCSGITSINIPDSVTSIGYSAFQGCSGITSINIPDSVTGISNSMFHSCSGLTSITIPDSVNAISGQAFWGCSGLTSIEIPDGVTTIPEWTFYGCSGLTSIEIPDSVTIIHVYAFTGCQSLTNMKIPDSVTDIGEYAFKGCWGLTSVTIGNNVTNIGREAFSGCTSLTSIEIPDSVISIGDNAFQSCSGLISIKIGNNVTDFGVSVFSGCSALQYNEYDNGYYLGNDSNLYLVLIGTKSKEITSCKIHDDTKVILSAFASCGRLLSIEIPDGVTSIGASAFIFCQGLTSITIPDSVTIIGENAFSFCQGLTSIIIPRSVTSIGERVLESSNSNVSLYYKGNKEDWSMISIKQNNSGFVRTTRYYYSEEQPTESGNYWHYDENGEIAVW